MFGHPNPREPTVAEAEPRPDPPASVDGVPLGADARELIRQMIAELYAAGRAQVARAPGGTTMSTGTVVHEAYLRLCRLGDVRWESRQHFVRFAARTMRNIIIDDLRRRGARRDDVALDTGNSPLVPPGTNVDHIALDEALAELEAEHPEWAQAVELIVYAGQSYDEAAAALGVSRATVGNYWRDGKRWLKERLGDDAAP